MAGVANAVHGGGVAEEDEKAKSQVEPETALKEVTGEAVTEDEKGKGKEETEVDQRVVEKEDAKGEEGTEVEIEAKSGVSFPVRLDDGKQLTTVGVRKKGVLGIGLKIYAFGIYADSGKLKESMRAKFGTAPEKPTKALYDAVIDSDVDVVVRLVIVFGGLTMSMVRKNFSEGLGASIKKLTGGQKNDELVNKVMGAASDSIKLSSGSVIEISRFPGYTLQTKVKGEVVSKLESELLCRAYFHLYLGDEPFDKEAKERFGRTLLSIF